MFSSSTFQGIQFLSISTGNFLVAWVVIVFAVLAVVVVDKEREEEEGRRRGVEEVSQQVHGVEDNQDLDRV